MRQIDCAESDRLRVGLSPLSSITNFVGGEVLDHRLPPHTATTWGNDDGVAVLSDDLDADGCRHWLLADPTQEAER